MQRRLIKEVRSLLVFTMLSASACSYLPEEIDISSPDVIVEETGDYILICAQETLPQRALVFVPGGFVDPHVYMCWMTDLISMYPEIAIVQIKVPSNLAILNTGKISKVMKTFDSIDSWVIGGHSLGGVVSVFEVSDQPEMFDGLILLASWATESKSLSDWQGEVLSLYGSNDGLATEEEIEENRAFLPTHTNYHKINGGNHSGFGCYGFQDGDLEASISQEEQKEEMVIAMINFFNMIWD